MPYPIISCKKCVKYELINRNRQCRFYQCWTTIPKIESILWLVFFLGWPNAYSTSLVLVDPLKDLMRCAFSPGTFLAKKCSHFCGFGMTFHKCCGFPIPILLTMQIFIRVSMLRYIFSSGSSYWPPLQPATLFIASSLCYPYGHEFQLWLLLLTLKSAKLWLYSNELESANGFSWSSFGTTWMTSRSRNW